jgi:two-component system, LuxR family, sensor kinase FixL
MEHARLHRSPVRTRAAGLLDDAALLALEAFDRGAALIDLTHRCLAWCSPGFASRCCVDVGEPLDQLELRLPGLVEALSRLGRPPAFVVSSDAADMAPRPRWRVVDQNGPSLVEATLVRPGLAAVRLRCDSESSGVAQEHERAVRRHLEDRERLLFTSRSLAVGEMASTLAHELNQPIGTVANVLRGMRARLERQPPDEELLGGVQLALEQALFAARIIARIREYTQSRQPRREPLDLRAVVRESVGLLDWELQRDGVQIELELMPAACRVSGDEVMLQQLFVNLLRNALEAMRDNPKDALGRATRRLALRLAPERGMAVLTLRDNGCGLPPDAQAQLFVPFQSTKPNGMGIGLNICRSFVELHQGRLWFTPNDEHLGERGCTFHVALPMVADGDTPTRSLA